MVGDVNLFCAGEEWSESAEISIMIAELNYRRKGIGTEAAMLMMLYAIRKLKVQCFIAKIGAENYPSIRMFTEKLHYEQESCCNIFNEVTLKYDVNFFTKELFSGTEYSECRYSSAEP